MEAAKPFRWSLLHRRSLAAMIAERCSPEKIAVPELTSLNQKLVAAALKRATKARTDALELRKQLDATIQREKRSSKDLLRCCSRVLALGSEYDLVFVGRSAESIFDHLSGLLFDTPFRERLTLLQLSVYYYRDKINWSRSLDSLKAYFESLKLDPVSISRKRRPVAFVDLVDTGLTFYKLMIILQNWSKELGISWKAVRKRIRLIGIVSRTKTSPNTWRWHQESRWNDLLEKNSIKNFSISTRYWGYLGNEQHKCTESFTDDLWSDPGARLPVRTSKRLVGLNTAMHWFELGLTSARREELAEALSSEPEMKVESVRKIVSCLRSTARASRKTDKISGRQTARIRG